jgi:hypothetical protein
MTCSDCSELLLDYLYGLLDVEPAGLLREHLAGCPACQAGLDQAKNRQNLFARAAHKFRDVPAFHLPADELEPTGVPAFAYSAVKTPARRTAAHAMPAERTRWRWRRWATVAAAAAVLLATMAAYGEYQSGVKQREQALSDAKKEVERVDAHFAGFLGEFKQENAILAQKVQGKYLHLHVLGPATYHPGAASTYRITTQSPDGKPATARVTMRLIVRPPDQEIDQELYKVEFPTAGELRLVLPKLRVPAGTSPLLVIEARSNDAKVVVEKALTVEEPTYLTHLAVNKSSLRAGDMLFFRSVTLERYSLAPIDADHKVTMGFTLYRVSGPGDFVPKKYLHGSTDAGGIAGGEFAITEDLPEGDYILAAVEIVPPGQKSHGVKAVARSLRIVRDDAPLSQIVLDCKRYQVGQTIAGQFRGKTKSKENWVANQPVVVKATTEKEDLGTLQLRTDAQGNANFNIALPPSMPPGDVQLELQLLDGVANKKFEQNVPVVRPEFRAEFFPEGGYLVAGVPNRVYFRLHVPLWAPADVKCTLENNQRQKVADVQVLLRAGAGQPALGYFTFTPQFGEVYRFGLSKRRYLDALPMPKVKANGIVLATPVSVLGPTEAVRMQLWTTQKNTEVLVLASCRGRVVDQKQFMASGLLTNVTLEPAPGASGVLRLTVFEKQGNEWRPAAERLVYRMPGEYLKLSALPTKGTRKPYPPGGSAKLRLEARNEVNALAPTWLHVLVIDAKAQQLSDMAQPGIGSYFLMTTELREPADLENTDFLLTDAAGATEALELFLGTQGWRGFLDTSDYTYAKLKDEDQAGEAMVPELFAGGTRQENVKHRIRRELDQKRIALWKDASSRLEMLKLERSLKVSAAERAAEDLVEYTDMPLQYLRPAVGVVFWLLVGGGALLLLAGLVVAVRGRRSPRFCLASALAALLCGLLLYNFTSPLRTLQDGDTPENHLAWLKLPQWSLGEPMPTVALAHEDRDGLAADKIVVRDIGSASLEKTTVRSKGEWNLLAFDELQKEDKNRQVLLMAQDSAEAAQKKVNSSVSLCERLEYAKELETKAKQHGMGGYGSYAGGGPGVTYGDKSFQDKPKTSKEQPPYPGPGADKKDTTKSPLQTAFTREYALMQSVSKQDYQDTVLWFPALLAADGTATVTFDLAGQETTYRVLIYGHSGDGRLGVYHGKLQAR